MPTYNYQCTNCETFFEKFKKISEPDPQYCPDCRKESLVKVISFAPPVQYRGEKWFKKSGEY